MIEIKTFGFSELEKLKADWESLQSGEDMTVFQQYIWYHSLNMQYEKGCFKGGEKAEYYAAYKDGKIKMIAPMHIKKHGFEYRGIGVAKGVYFIGQWSFTDYLNFIYDDFDPECAQAIIDGIKKKYPRLNIYFSFIKENNSLDAFLKKRFSDSFKGSSTCIQALPCADFETYHKGLSKHTRQNIRTAFNREEKNGIETHIKVLENVSESDAEEFFSIYLKRSESKNTLNLKRDGLKNTVYNYYNKLYNKKLKENLGKFNYVTSSMTNNPCSLLLGIFSGEKKIGFIYFLKEPDGTLRNAIVCFDEEYSFYTPGMTAFFRFFREYVYSEQRGAPVTVDMTRGVEPYKYKLGGTEHYLNNYIL